VESTIAPNDNPLVGAVDATSRTKEVAELLSVIQTAVPCGRFPSGKKL
jgi:hypothetical protein